MAVIVGWIFLFLRNGEDLLGYPGPGSAEEGNVLMQAMASNGLIFVVLAVSLSIWFLLVFYLLKLEKKISLLEKEIQDVKERK
ncbi:hypothetical protein QLX67_03820 [Balneolaceae bacterium ANBcel3]|nr:hypothetical protein [Balneolaceae bacterium ANBcel3]